MDMYSRNQYLQKLQEEYLQASKKEKSKLLNEAVQRTVLVRKYLVRKLNVRNRWESKIRKKRKEYYDGQVKATLVRCWEIFDRPCGQRLKPSLETEVDRLRMFGELVCSDEVALKLKNIKSATIDRKLVHQKEVELLKRKYHKKKYPWLYAQIPIKISSDFNRDIAGQEQIDLVEHCGASNHGDFLSTLSVTDVAFGWWEGEAIMGRSQGVSFIGLTDIRFRSPIVWLEIHPDNDTTFINWHLYQYCQKEELNFSRSRPYKKNDNCFVEQKNSTHVRGVVGYCRYDTKEEQVILNSLYRNELRLYKNFFQPVMKLANKIREKGKIHRQYDKPQTPYQRILESTQIPVATKQELKAIYDNLNPAQLKRNIDGKLNLLYEAYQNKNNNANANILKVEPKLITIKKLKPTMVTF